VTRRNVVTTEKGRESLAEISAEIERAARQRAELLHTLAERHDRTTVSKCADLDDRLAGLWESHRLVRARLLYGDRDEIRQRARREERILRSA
jgi:hypothetical protein